MAGVQSSTIVSRSGQTLEKPRASSCLVRSHCTQAHIVLQGPSVSKMALELKHLRSLESDRLCLRRPSGSVKFLKKIYRTACQTDLLLAHVRAVPQVAGLATGALGPCRSLHLVRGCLVSLARSSVPRHGRSKRNQTEERLTLTRYLWQ